MSNPYPTLLFGILVIFPEDPTDVATGQSDQGKGPEKEKWGMKGLCRLKAHARQCFVVAVLGCGYSDTCPIMEQTFGDRARIWGSKVIQGEAGENCES